MAITINSPGWKVRTRSTRSGGSDRSLQGLPPEFVAADARVADESIVERTPAARGSRAARSDRLDVSYDIAPDKAAYLAVRHASGAITFHLPAQRSDTRGAGRAVVRFQVVTRERTTRGLVGRAIKVILVEVRKVAVDAAVSFVLPRLAAALERSIWDKAGRKEGWHAVSRDTLVSGTLAPGVPTSVDRSLLLLHGTFSHAAAAFRDLADSPFFDHLADTYGGRIFAFNHFSISRTPEENAKMLLQALPEQATTFDVVTHSRGGLVLRNLVERAAAFGPLAQRFHLHRAVLVAAPNEGTPLATPQRWEDTFGWFANLLDMFPDSPLTTGAAFVANGMVWLANHAAGDLPGLKAMDGDGELITELQRPPGPDAGAYSAIVANYHPEGQHLHRLLDAGLDQFFGTANDLVVPTEGGWRIDGEATNFVPGGRIGCFGAGGNLGGDTVTHVNIFAQRATADFIVNAFTADRQPLSGVDPRKPLPSRRLMRSVSLDAPISATIPGPRAANEAAADTDTGGEFLPRLRVSIVHGDLTFEPDALLIGHYAATQLGGAEKVIDNLIGGAMKRSLDLGHYPNEIGTQQIFINTRIDLERGSKVPRPKAVIVAGLGQEGAWAAAALITTVKHAVLAWSARLAEQRKANASFTLSSTLMSSGGAGVAAGDAARLVAQGVAEANELLFSEVEKGSWPRVERLKLIELYLDRASDAWRALRMQEEAAPDRYVVDDTVENGVGGMQRPSDSGYRGASYDFISVENAGGELIYTLDTRRSRNPLRAKRMQTALLRHLVTKSSDDPQIDRTIGRTLFNLLVPIELEAYMGAKGALLLQLDPSVADIPWELLDTNPDDDVRRATAAPPKDPWAIRTKVIRKLRIQSIREQVNDANVDDRVLVIGEPLCRDDRYSRLYGAHHEAKAVQACLAGALDVERVCALVSADIQQRGADAHEIVSKLYEHPWRIVHIAGHGEPKSEKNGGGVVLSDDTFLGATEIESMRIVPELVFINCCHLGRGDDNALLNTRYDRSAFASTIAEQLIRIGVRCVIAAGWAVDDDAANAFAVSFYAALLRGEPLIDAVGAARKAAYERSPESNTWAAYQCYGDPEWTFRRSERPATPSTEEFDGIASVVALKLALSRITVETKFQGRNPQTQIHRLRRLEDVFKSKFEPLMPVPTYGATAELFGEAFSEAGELTHGIDWYRRAMAAADGTASLRAVEQLSNTQARRAWITVDAVARMHSRALERQAAERARGAKAAATKAVMDAARQFQRAVAEAERQLAEALARLEKLRKLEVTLERESLIGSVHKRRALIASLAGDHKTATAALRAMADAYLSAETHGRREAGGDLYYPLSNRLVAAVALNAGRRGWKVDAALLKAVRTILDERSLRADFWNLVGDIEVDQLEAVARGTFASRVAHFKKRYDDLYIAVKAPRMWGSVYDTSVLVLVRYRDTVKGRSRTAVEDLLTTLRRFAHPE